jgi:hypothetical protein
MMAGATLLPLLLRQPCPSTSTMWTAPALPLAANSAVQFPLVVAPLLPLVGVSSLGSPQRLFVGVGFLCPRATCPLSGLVVLVWLACSCWCLGPHQLLLVVAVLFLRCYGGWGCASTRVRSVSLSPCTEVLPSCIEFGFSVVGPLVARFWWLCFLLVRLPCGPFLWLSVWRGFLGLLSAVD